jgi:hypothetical protein
MDEKEVHDLAEQARGLGPEMIGGFVAYFLHHARHEIFRRGHHLIRLIFKPRRPKP